MTSARESALDRLRGKSDSQSLVDFDCTYCLPVDECPTLPSVEEYTDPQGHVTTIPLTSTQVLEIYNNRRWEHYLRDFDTASQLKEHLEQRARYFSSSKEALEMNLLTVRTDVEHWEWAKRARRDAQPRQGELTT